MVASEDLRQRAGWLRDYVALLAGPASNQIAFVWPPGGKRPVVAVEELYRNLVEELPIWLDPLSRFDLFEAATVEGVRDLTAYLIGLPAEDAWRQDRAVFREPVWTEIRRRARQVEWMLDADLKSSDARTADRAGRTGSPQQYISGVNDPARLAWARGAAMTVTLTRERGIRGGFDGARFATASERAGLLVDLALKFDCADMTSLFDLDPGSVDFAPARAALTDIRREPPESVEQWIGHGTRLTTALADEWEQLAVWKGHRGWPRDTPRYVDSMPEVIQLRRAIGARCEQISRSPADDPVENATAAILQIAGLSWTGEYEPSDALIAACGTAGWLVARTSVFMVDARRRSSSGLQAHPIGPGM